MVVCFVKSQTIHKIVVLLLSCRILTVLTSTHLYDQGNHQFQADQANQIHQVNRADLALQGGLVWLEKTQADL